LGGLEWMEGRVPTPDGEIRLFCSAREIKIYSNTGTGTLQFSSQRKPLSNGNNKIVSKGGNLYEMKVDKGRDYGIDYVYVD
jgi:alpha-L-rhamnosidase